jgi:hypothetical protein
LLVISSPSSERSFSVEIGTSKTVKALSEPSVSGLLVKAALLRFCWVKASLLTISAPPAGRSPTFGLERGRVHRDQHVGSSPGRVDVGRGEADLEPGDAGQRARGRADLGREVRQGC